MVIIDIVDLRVIGESNMSNWVTVKQLAKYLQISSAKVYQLAQTGNLPASKVGNRWRFDLEKVDRWMDSEKSSSKGNLREN